MIQLEDAYKDAIKYQLAGDVQMAGKLLDFLVSRQPNNPNYLFSLACVHYESGHTGTAMQILHRCLDLGSRHPGIYCNLGVCYRKAGHEKTAQEIYAEALKLNPEEPQLLSNMAGAFVNWGMPDKVIEFAEKALKADPSYIQAEHHLALGLMEKGEFERGWKHYDARFGIPEHQPYKRPYDMARWRGEKVKRLLIHGEQGLGDEVLAAGWFNLCRPFADEIVIEATERLLETFRRSFPEMTILATPDECLKTGPIDAFCPMLSLPQIFGMKRDKEYLKTDPQKVAFLRERLKEFGPGPYIGMSWHGGTMATHGYLRTAKPDYWKPLLKYGNPISIQHGPSGEQMAEELDIPHWPFVTDDVEQLIHLIAACDLIVTVNNTNAHISGALGRPCFTMTPSRPAWRYQLAGEKMLWYDSVRQFRQVGDDWGPPYERVEKAIADFCGISGTQQAAA